MSFFTFSNLLSHILVQVQNERFHHQRHSPSSLQKLFSLYSSLGQFLGPCNFLAISLRAQKLVRKGSLLIPAPISSPLTQLQATQPQTDFRQLLKAETFLNRTISEIVNFPQKGYFEADIGFQNWRKELYPRVHLWMPIFIGTLKKYGEAQYWTLNKNVKGRIFMDQNYINGSVFWRTKSVLQKM